MNKILVYAKKNSNLLEVLIAYMNKEKIEHIIEHDTQKLTNAITNIIYIDESNQPIPEFILKAKLPILIISGKRNIWKSTSNINYIITNLIHDDTNYTSVQKEYLLKNGIYNIFIQKIKELLENYNNYNGMIYDLTELKTNPEDWIFSFNSINDTYAWLSKKNKILPEDFTRKVINFYNDKVYDDSLREINYLTEKVVEIKEKKQVIDIFICTKEELKKFRQNYFFKLLIKNISSTYQFYLIDKNQLFENDKNIAMKLLDGIAIYNDCIYRDTYDNEISLGYVDCKEKTIQEYNNYFDYILKKYGHPIYSESDLNEF